MMDDSFLQSSEWEDFQGSLGRKTWRAEGALIIRHDLPGGFNYLYCPRPQSVTSNLLLITEGLARKEKSIFLKIDPSVPLPVTSYRLLVTSPIQPRKTVILGLQKAEEEMLPKMHEKTRYNIRLAERRGVQITNYQPSSTNQFNSFWRLLQETAERDGFHVHGQDHYRKLLAVNSPVFSNELFLAEYGGEIIASAMVNFYKPSETATYLHGASSRKSKEAMAPHLLHWHIIKEAKNRGFRYYDLWGVDEKKWPGLTRFKSGFGGETIEYPPSVDIVYRPVWYNIYKLSGNIRSRT